MDAARQTVRFLKQKFAEVGFRPQSRLGQNFLIDLNLLDLIVRVADVQPTDVVLEVGTGTGSLTTRLAAQAAAVVSVEMDPLLARLAAEQLEHWDNVSLLQQDALRNKNHFHAHVISTTLERLQQHAPAQLKLVANLPYSVATPVISNLLASEMAPASMTVTIQKELADRIVAEPRTKDYGSLSVWVQSQCVATIVREMQPSVFWPRPKVHSAIVQIVTVPQQRDEVGDLALFHRFVRGLFLHRRKFLRSALCGAFKELTKADVDRAMGALQFGPETRAEELTVRQILELATACGMRRPAGTVDPPETAP